MCGVDFRRGHWETMPAQCPQPVSTSAPRRCRPPSKACLGGIIQVSIPEKRGSSPMILHSTRQWPSWPPAAAQQPFAQSPHQRGGRNAHQTTIQTHRKNKTQRHTSTKPSNTMSSNSEPSILTALKLDKQAHSPPDYHAIQTNPSVQRRECSSRT